MLRLPLICLAFLCAAIALAVKHPANIPVARAKVQPNGAVDFKIRFDVLAFVLDQTPADATDPAMNAILDGPERDLEDGLREAKKRFLGGFATLSENGPGVVEGIDFPSVADIRHFIETGPKSRLPVMMTVSLKCHLSTGSHSISFHFPEVLGTVVLTTEFPYQEPLSEPVEPGVTSMVHSIPSQAEIDKAAASISAHDLIRNSPTPHTEDEARKAIKGQYDAWSAAYMKNDVDQLLSILSPDYTLKTATGSVITHSEYEVMLNMRKKRNTDTSVYSTEILRLTLHDDVAALLSRETSVTRQKNDKTGKMETVNHQHDYIDVWAFTGGKWLLKSTVTQRERTQVK
jgi:hypothetical protein